MVAAMGARCFQPLPARHCCCILGSFHWSGILSYTLRARCARRDPVMLRSMILRTCVCPMCIPQLSTIGRPSH
eukprot:3463272-Pyramimonas_sp.AAC.1